MRLSVALYARLRAESLRTDASCNKVVVDILEEHLP